MYSGQKSYSYIKANSVADAAYLYSSLDNSYNHILQKVLYLGFAVEIPFESFHSRPVTIPIEIQNLIPGTFLFPDFFNEAEVKF